jgi:NTP pyrophosphatase (non-canonical NTP hydrolase)
MKSEQSEVTDVAESQLATLIVTTFGCEPLPWATAGTTRDGLEAAQNLCHFLAARSGWWADMATGQRLTADQVNIPEKLCLIHSEVSEAMEGHRKDLMDDKLPHRKMLEVELADAMIRILDLAGFLGLDLAGATIEKLAYNQVRQDHKLENRAAEGGKKF